MEANGYFRLMDFIEDSAIAMEDKSWLIRLGSLALSREKPWKRFPFLRNRLWGLALQIEQSCQDYRYNKAKQVEKTFEEPLNGIRSHDSVNQPVVLFFHFRLISFFLLFT